MTVGRTIGRETVITKGIAPGETVVTDGQLRLIPGFKVEIVSGAPAKRSGGAPMNISETLHPAAHHDRAGHVGDPAIWHRGLSLACR